MTQRTLKNDECECNQMCKHETRCLGGHANYPHLHWYACDYCWDASVHALFKNRNNEKAE